jgi:hypothetical protein
MAPANEIMAEYEQTMAGAKDKWLTEEGGEKALLKAGSDPGKLAKIVVPLHEFQKAGLQRASELLQPQLDQLGGNVSTRVKEIDFSSNQRSTDMRRGVSQLLSELVLSRVKTDVFPEIQEKLYAVKLPKIPGSNKIQTQLASLVFNQAEGSVRKQIHARVKQGHAELNQSMLPTGCGMADEIGKEAEEDEFGFLKSKGGFKTFKGSMSGLDPMKFVTRVLDEDVNQKIQLEMKEIEQVVDQFEKKTEAARDKWLRNEGGQKLVDKAAASGGGLAPEVPVADFLRSGTAPMIATLQSKLEAMGGEAAERAKQIQVPTEARSTDARQGMDLLLQEVILASAKSKILKKILKKKIKQAELPRMGGKALKAKVTQLACDQAEGNVRKQVHEQVLAAYATIGEKMTPDGCTAAVEDGEEAETDAYGFLVSSGGYKSFKGPIGLGVTDPRSYVDKVLDPAIQDNLQAQAENIQTSLHQYKGHCESIRDQWLNQVGAQELLDRAVEKKKRKKGKKKDIEAAESDVTMTEPEPENDTESGIPGMPGADALTNQMLIDAAKGKKSELKLIKVPLHEFQKAGLQRASELLQPQLDQLGGSVATRVKEINFSSNQRSTDMRRGVSQLLSELVLSRVKTDVFPEIQERLDRLPLPASVKTKVARLVYQQAEDQVRLQVHGQVNTAYRESLASLAPDGCGVVKEAGKILKEDSFGFVKQKGSTYKDFVREGGSGTLESLGLSERLKGGADADDDSDNDRDDASHGSDSEGEEESDDEMTHEEMDELHTEMKKPLKFDKTLLDQNPVHRVKRYKELSKIVDKRAQTKITTTMSTPKIKNMMNDTMQDMSFVVSSLAIDPEIDKTLDTLRYTPESTGIETVMPELFKRILRKAAEQTVEGIVRCNVDKMVTSAYRRSSSTFKNSIPGLDSLPLALDEDALEQAKNTVEDKKDGHSDNETGQASLLGKLGEMGKGAAKLGGGVLAGAGGLLTGGSLMKASTAHLTDLIDEDLRCASPCAVPPPCSLT